MPVAVMTRGTIIGEIKRPVMNERAGISGRDKPRAANVPKVVATIVEMVAMKNELRVARSHCALFQASWNHAHESGASGFAIPFLKIS